MTELPVVVVALAFSKPRNTPANLRLAEALGKAVQGINSCVVVTQEDLSTAYLPRGVEVVKVPDDERGPPPTLRIVRAAVDAAVEREVARIVVVCAGPHWPRVRRDLAYALQERGVAVEIVPPPQEMLALPEKEWFSRHSVQYHTRNYWVWCVRERILLLLWRFFPRLYGIVVG